MLAHLCRARIWTLPTDDNREGTLKQKSKQVDKSFIHYQEVNKNKQIRCDSEKDEARSLCSYDTCSQITDNPCYGLTDPGEKHDRIRIQSKPTQFKDAHQKKIVSQDNNIVAVLKTPEKDTTKKYLSQQTVKNSDNSCESISGCQTHPMPRSTGRTFQGIDERFPIPNQQQKSLEDVVNMFDYHLNMALLHQRKKVQSKHSRVANPDERNKISSKQQAVDLLRRSTKSHIPDSTSNKDVEKQLEAASKNKPVNVPMVVMQCSQLKSHTGKDLPVQDSALAMGSLVYALFGKADWLCVRTPHGKVGYIHRVCCMPMSTLSQRRRTTNDSNSVTDEFIPGMKNVINPSKQLNVGKNSKAILYGVLADVNPSCFQRINSYQTE